MTPAGEKLTSQPWMQTATVRAVLAALAAAPGTSRFVGGCVRNALIGREVEDIDIATTHTPEAVAALLEKAGLRAAPTGIEHGTITAVAGGHPYEITTLRRDVSTDGRRAVVAYTDDWKEDAARRDFTMNALYADADGTLYDPAGGLDDLKAGRVRFIGDPKQRIAEDYLRILRFFRIHAAYGAGELDRAGLSACAAAKDELKRLSGERIQKEMLKLLALDEPVATLRAMAASGVLPEILPGTLNFPRFERLAGIERDQFFASDAVLRLASLMTRVDQAKALAARWRLSVRDSERIAAVLSASFRVVSYLSIREVRRLLYREGVALFKDVAMLRWAEDPKIQNDIPWRALLAMADSWVRPKFPLTGDDVMHARVPPGPLVGQVLKEVEDWWVEADFIDDPFSIAERLKAVAQAVAP